MAMRFVARLHQERKIALPIRQLFDHPNAEDLALVLDKLETDQGPQLIPGMGTLADNQVVLSYGQKRLWALDRVQGASATYNTPIAIRLKGHIHIEALGLAAQLLIERHRSLRTVIVEDVNGLPKGVLLETPNIEKIFSVINLSSLHSDDTHDQKLARAREYAQQEASTPFNLEKDPSFRLKLILMRSDDAILSITLHHQASDAESMGILMHELNSAYLAFSNKESHKLAKLDLHYSDWAAWQQATLELDIERKIERAKDRLKHAPALLTLPLDHPRDPHRDRRAEHVSVVVPSSITRHLQELALRQGTTLFTVVLSLYGATLSRLSGQQDVVIGTPVSGRTRIETENLIGFLVNMLALPIHLDTTCNGLELIKRTRSSVEAALIDQDLPFERLVEELGAQRSLAHAPVFQATLTFAGDSGSPIILNGLECSDEMVALPVAKTDIALFLNLTNKGELVGGIAYDADLFDQSSVEGWVKSFLQIAESLTANSHRPVLTLPFTDSEQKGTALKHSTSALRDAHITQSTVVQLFTQTVNVYASKLALTSELGADKVALSYQELDEQSNCLARYLMDRGIGSGQIVGICMERSPEMVVAMMAVIKSGAAYMPLDASHPLARLEFMLKDSHATSLLADSAGDFLLGHARDKLGIAVINLDDFGVRSMLNIISDEQIKADERQSPISPDDLIYLIYTSGSTGTPKGVATCHRNVCAIAYKPDYCNLTAESNMLHLASTAFDATTFEVWGALLNGATLAFPPTSKLSLSDLSQSIRHYQTNIAFLTTSLFTTALTTDPEIFSPLNEVLVGGEVIPPHFAASFIKLFPHKRLMNVYGPTETTTFSNATTLTIQDTQATELPIGKPVTGYQTYVLDVNLEPVPTGVIGELYIAGEGVARGYLDRPGLTAERFIACPHHHSGARMYKTGDRVRQRADGAIVYLSRLDNQVKIRGFRIELGEIESCLIKEFTSLAQVHVIVREIANEKRIVAYFVPHAHQRTPTANEIREKLLEKLPDYMVPSYYVSLEKIPLNVNGKIDLSKLPDPSTIQSSSTETRVPRTPQEVLLCRMFSELTGTDLVGIDDNFFAIGGHSLLAISLIAKLRDQAGYSLSLASLFEHPTVQTLAKHLVSSGPAKYSPLLALRKTGSAPPLFCIHPGGGNATVYTHLCNALGNNQPVWALQARGLEDGETVQDRIDDMSVDYVTAIRSIQPHGPYHLLGWSLGGTIAQEMAAQLETQGEQVKLLALMDTAAIYPEHVLSEEWTNEKMLERLTQELGDQDTADHHRDRAARLELVRDSMAKQDVIPMDTPIEWIDRLIEQQAISTIRLRHHQQKNIQADILFFRASQEPTPEREETYEWNSWTSGHVTEINIETTHDLMCNQEISKEVARHLNDYLVNIEIKK
jgi:amino acid adenylation domain-containing protein